MFLVYDSQDLLIVQVHVIIEAILDGGAIAETAPVHSLHGFTQDVCTGVPVNLKNSHIIFFVATTAAEPYYLLLLACLKKMQVVSVCGILHSFKPY